MTPEEAITIWIRHFQTTLFQGISEPEIAKLMTPVARDDAWIHYGGTGRRSRLYLIDDYLQARFDFDHQDVLLSYAVYKTAEGWLKGPDGVLLRGAEAPDAELLFP
jgi:hypothetical protein